MLLLDEGEFALNLKVFIASILDVLAQDLDEPQFGVILHEREVKIRELLHPFFAMVANIARIPKYFC